MLNEYGSLKLSDFGKAKRMVDMIKTDSTNEGSKKGTPYYMAPELFEEHGVKKYFFYIFFRFIHFNRIYGL